MDKNDPLTLLVSYIADLNEVEALSLVKERITKGENPLQIVEDCQEGVSVVGERYEKREYYLSGLIMAGEIFRQIMVLLEPIIQDQFSGNESGLILLGTVRGDIHDLGKNNLSILLTSHGFTVIDLGVDVLPSEFLHQATINKPDVIGLSGVLTSAFNSMKETIELIRTSGKDDIASVPILIGGNQLNEQVCNYVRADYWTNDAMIGVRICQQIMAPKNNN